MRFKPRAALCVFFCAFLAATTARGQNGGSAIERETVELLRRYVRIDTTNPPGNEIKAAQFFKEIFDREGIEARIIESAPGRGNLYARLPGSGGAPAIVLLNHMDVVPVNPKQWQEEPFGATLKDGYIWGRGTRDMKGPAIVELMTLLQLKRQNVRLRGDVIFLGTADEEAGGAMGAGYLVQKHAELFKGVGLVLNEGGSIELDKDGRVKSYRVSVAEKTPLWLKLTAKGQPGHGSTPGNNLAVNRLVSALGKIMAYQSPVRVVPEVQSYYADIADGEPESRRERYRDLRSALADPLFAKEFLRSPRNAASVRNTVAVTRVSGSNKVNVIPAEAWAEIDVRLLPGEDPQAFINELKKVMGDDSIKIEILLSFPAAKSPSHPQALRIIGEIAQQHDNASVVSPLVRGFTDCHFFRELGLPCFGFIPLRNHPSESGLTHGVNERIATESLHAGVRTMLELVTRLAQ